MAAQNQRRFLGKVDFLVHNFVLTFADYNQRRFHNMEADRRRNLRKQNSGPRTGCSASKRQFSQAL
jgi:hypothetical protein